MEWAGGAYGLPTSMKTFLNNIILIIVPGSRSGAPAAGAWFAMMHLGKAGYKELAKKMFTALNYLKSEISAIPELEILGNPIVNTIAFRSKNEKELNSYSIKKALSDRGWTLTGILKVQINNK